MPITLTPIAYLLRGGPEHCSAKTKDPYVFSGVVKAIGDTAEITGVCGEMNTAYAREIIGHIKEELGVSKVVWDRANGKRVEV